MKNLSKVFMLVILTLMNYQIIQAQTPKMNEVYSRGVAGNLDWIEIYNPTDASIDISGYKIYDTGGQAGTKPKKLLPAGTILPAKGFYFVITDTASFDGDLSGFGLSSGGETVWFEDAAGILIDTVAIPALGVDTSFARVPDGSNTMVKVTPLTKGTSNVLIKMNELYSRGVAGNLDWIEIFNSSSLQIDISGFKIYDSGGQAGTKPKKLIPTGTLLASKGFYVVTTDTASFDGDLSGFGLSSGGETVWLENASGLIMDTVAMPALGVDTTFARMPDGSNIFAKIPATKGVSNETFVPVELVSFSFSVTENALTLNWETVTETNNNGFEVQRKSNDQKFDVIGFVKGNGNTTEKQKYSFTDLNLGKAKYQYRLKQIDFDGTYSFTEIIEFDNLNIPMECSLNQNYPNPFNPTTKISFSIPAEGLVTLGIYNLLGEEVMTLVNEVRAAGNYELMLNASRLSSGVYMYKLKFGEYVSAKKMVVLK